MPYEMMLGWTGPLIAVLLVFAALFIALMLVLGAGKNGDGKHKRNRRHGK